MSDFTDKLIAGAIILGIGAGIMSGTILGLNLATTGNAFKFPAPGSGLGGCSEWIKVTHNQQPVGSLEIKTNSGYYVATTNSTGIATLPNGCFGPVTLTYNGTDYSVTPQDGKLVEVKV